MSYQFCKFIYMKFLKILQQRLGIHEFLSIIKIKNYLEYIFNIVLMTLFILHVCIAVLKMNPNQKLLYFFVDFLDIHLQFFLE